MDDVRLAAGGERDTMKRVSPVGEFEIGETMDPRMMRGSTEPMPVPPFAPVVPATASAELAMSYHPTRWARVNRILDVADRVTSGRAGILQRVFNYLLFGGFASLINLFIITALYEWVKMPGVSSRVHYLIAFVVATEVSIVANFIPQDMVTFSHLAGHSRSWLVRCLRFHLTSLGGVIVTAIVSFTLREVVGLQVTIAQAIAILVALVFNFTFHHLFTYRHVEQQVL
jgi:putative flippase GtrA